MDQQPVRDSEGLSVLVVGNDMLIEVLPARPIQLAHACGKVGFDLVIPLSWGDELVAEAAVAELSSRLARPAVLCTCPLVRQRLFATGAELAPAVVATVSPPVAISRQLRATLGSRIRSLAFVGRCPSARPPHYDMAFDPVELLALLASRGIDVQGQPDVFLDTIPPDRRRYWSSPGGCPTPEMLWQRCHETVLVDLETNDLAVDLAQLLLTPQSILVDLAQVLGCACSGMTTVTTGRQARIAVTSLEPPRSPDPVIEATVGLQLTEELPSAARAESDYRVRAGTESGGIIRPQGSDVSLSARPPMAVTPQSALTVRSRPP